MKKLLSILLAILCVMNLTIVSFAVEETEAKVFDEKTGTLNLFSEEQWEAFCDELYDENGEIVTIYGQEYPAKEVELIRNVTTINIGKNMWADEESMDYSDFFQVFINVKEINIDEEHPSLCIYENGVYTKDKTKLLFYPYSCEDTDIVLPKETVEISPYVHIDYCTNLYEKPYVFFGLSENFRENPISLYVTGGIEQLNALLESESLEIMFLCNVDNIYVDAIQEEIDSLIQSKSDYVSWDIYNRYIISYSWFMTYYVILRFDSEGNNIARKYYDDFSEFIDNKLPEKTEEETEKEYGARITTLLANYANELCMKYEYTDYTREEFELAFDEDTLEEMCVIFGSKDEAYLAAKEMVEYIYNRYIYLSNRGNPVKPLSTLTSGTCGEGVEWAIDRENGVLSITGNGAIADNYSGFDVFKDIITTVEIGNGITAIGENVFTGFDALTETKFNGTQSQWSAVTVADGNDDLLKNVTVNPDPPVEPEEEPTFWDKVVEFFNEVSNFFIKVFDWFKNLLGI